MPAWPWWVSSFALGCLVAWALAGRSPGLRDVPRSYRLGCSVAGSALGLFMGALAGLVMPDLFTTWLGFVAVVALNGFLGHALLKSVHAAEHVLPPW